MRALIFVLVAAALDLSAGPRVVMIGVDGMGAQWIPKAEMPRLRELMKRGAWTLHARGVMPTSSSPNWASMIKGAGPEQHGVTSNDWEADHFEFSPSCRGSESIFPTVFGLLREQQPQSRIALFHDWVGFARLVEKSAPNKALHIKDAEKITAEAIRYWKAEKPDILFLHLDHVDHAGHKIGWGTPEYFQALALADKLIGDVMDAAGSETYIFVSADHGGNGRKHGGLTMGELEIPWILAGPDVPKGHEIQGPVNTFDTAATVARIFKLKTPDCWIGRPVGEALYAGSAALSRRTAPAGKGRGAVFGEYRAP